MDNSSNTVLAKKVAPRCHFNPSGSHLFYYIVKTTPSDAVSREEHDGSKHKLVGGMTAKLWPDLCQGVEKNTEREMRMKTLLKKATFPTSFDDWSHQNENLMVSKIVVIVLLL